MRIKEYMMKEMRIMAIQKKSMGLMFYIPIAVNWCLLPILVFLLHHRWGDDGFTYVEALKLLQLFIPFFLSWWLLLALSEHIEGVGNELYYTMGRMKTGEVCIWTVMYLCMTAIPFLLYQSWLTGIEQELLRIAIECVFFAGFSYLLLFLSSSSAVLMAVSLIYTFASSFGVTEISAVIRYSDGEIWSAERFYEKYIFFLAGGIFMLAAGACINSRYKNYQ